MFNYDTRRCIFKPDENVDWCSHYAGPVYVENISPKTLRVFFSGTAKDRVSRIGYFDISSALEPDTVRLSHAPVLDIGQMGCFDENGVAYPWLVQVDGDTVFLYYTGWIKGGIGVFINAVGLAISQDNGKTFKRVSKAPILGRTPD